ncbi:MAG: hypothetical protein E5W74_15005 [Mesorhizobium sp.]|uniref:hypothetical protein n=1 Tax=Mesorhizobium sp. TaxID=1871066 RepID=UPI0011F760BA|nr:hypothetical protein [Mesorhizobium sp.]TIT10884.1 MAG: hypothetical protein E5W74_15005 [Mesorhizobium sp.]
MFDIVAILVKGRRTDEGFIPDTCRLQDDSLPKGGNLGDCFLTDPTKLDGAITYVMVAGMGIA